MIMTTSYFSRISSPYAPPDRKPTKPCLHVEEGGRRKEERAGRVRGEREGGEREGEEGGEGRAGGRREERIKTREEREERGGREKREREGRVGERRRKGEGRLIKYSKINKFTKSPSSVRGTPRCRFLTHMAEIQDQQISSGDGLEPEIA